MTVFFALLIAQPQALRAGSLSEAIALVSVGKKAFFNRKTKVLTVFDAKTGLGFEVPLPYGWERQSANAIENFRVQNLENRNSRFTRATLKPWSSSSIIEFSSKGELNSYVYSGRVDEIYRWIDVRRAKPTTDTRLLKEGESGKILRFQSVEFRKADAPAPIATSSIKHVHLPEGVSLESVSDISGQGVTIVLKTDHGWSFIRTLPHGEDGTLIKVEIPQEAGPAVPATRALR